jgi:hypothetical protein
MKKLFIAASLIAASFSVNAQDTQTTTTTRTTTSSDGEGFISKNGHQVLPQAGDWSLAIDAVPVLNYVGNAFNFNGGTTNTINNNFAGSPFTNSVPTVTGRKMLDANTAIRARFGVNLISSTTKTNVNKIGGTATEYVEDEVNSKQSNFYISAGLEKRKGNHRVQGIYGAELVVAIVSNANTKNTYGNALSASNTTTRTLETKVGNQLTVGPRGFVGVEYFFAPKISLGAEFGYGIYIQKTGDSETTTESWNGSAATTTTTPSTAGGGAGVGATRFTTDNLGGAITLNFFF